MRRQCAKGPEENLQPIHPYFDFEPFILTFDDDGTT